MFMSPSVQRFGFASRRSGLPASSRMGGFVLDTSGVLNGFVVLDKAMLLRVNNGLRLAGLKFMNDTVIGLPTVPIRRPTWREPVPYGGRRTPGGLRGSGTTFVGKVKAGTTDKYGTPEFQTNIYGGTPIMPLNPQACIVFNAPYAARQHEAFALKTEPTAGMYFMSTKLYGNGHQYMAIIARAIRL